MIAPSPPSASRLLRVEHAVAEALLEFDTPDTAFPRLLATGVRTFSVAPSRLDAVRAMARSHPAGGLLSAEVGPDA